MSGIDSVGTLLADIANLISDARRILGLADKRHWGLDEHEQLRAIDDVLDEARKDFQELSPLVHGSSYYQNDRRRKPLPFCGSAHELTPQGADESVEELRALRARFRNHILTLRDWARSGGPINATWIRDTHALQKDLHRAQCRAAQRIFTSDQESSQRCLGAFLVRRIQTRRRAVGSDNSLRPRLLEELRTCAAVGGFERFGDQDIAFVCDFCDGHMVWEDLEDVPVPRAANVGAAHSFAATTAATTTTANPSWQAPGTSASAGLEKQVVSAPLVVANHIAPPHGDWQARLLCPFCEEEAQLPQDDDDDDAYRPVHEFDDLAALEEHLAWQHTAAALPVPLPSSDNCQIM